MGLTFESDVPVERRAMHCPSGYITGLQVRHGRDSKADTDMYDFKLKCGGRWGPWSGMTFSSYKEEKAQECPLKMHMTGLEVKQGRKEIGDVDTYDFKLQCSGVWQPYMGLTFSNQQNLASKECPPGTMAFGWRAYRGFVKCASAARLPCMPSSDPKDVITLDPSALLLCAGEETATSTSLT